MRYTIAGMITGLVLAIGGALALSWSTRDVDATTSTISTQPTTGSTDDLIPQPDHQVAFSADVRIFEVNEPPVYGRFYQSSDGSTRYESGPAVGDVRVISILNANTSTQYRYSKAGWFNSYHPVPSKVRKKFRRNQHNITELPGRVVIDLERGTYFLAGDTETPEQTFKAISVAGDKGDMFIMAPELNFFVLVNQSGPGGRRQVHGNVQIGEQPPHLFEPPTGVEVQQDPNPPFQRFQPPR